MSSCRLDVKLVSVERIWQNRLAIGNSAVTPPIVSLDTKTILYSLTRFHNRPGKASSQF